MIEFHQFALEELRQAQSWYQAKSVQAAERFFEYVAKAMARMAASPESHPVIGQRFRYVRVSGFPFILVYRIRGDQDLFVTAFAHTSRRPGYWNRRR